MRRSGFYWQNDLTNNVPLKPDEENLKPFPRWGKWAIGGVLALTVLLIYHLVFADSFINWDDIGMVIENQRLKPQDFTRDTWNLHLFWVEIYSGFMGLYTPLAYSLWWVITHLFGVKAPAFHTLNILLHTGNVILVYHLLERIFRNMAKDLPRHGAACLGALFFAIHPIQVEAVAWVSGMNNLLAAFFSLYALLRYCDFWLATKRRNRIEYYLFANLGLLLALCSKPTALVTPLIAGIIGVLLLRKSIWKVALSLVPWAILMIPFILIGKQVQDATFVAIPLYQRPIIVCDTIAFYLSHIAFPYNLCADYSRTPASVLAHWTRQPTWLVTPVILGVAIYFWKRNRWLGITLLLLVIGIAPVTGIVPFFFQFFSTVANRYVYLGMLGPTVLIAALFVFLPSRKCLYSLAGILALFATISFHQTISWGATYTWAQNIIDRNPRSVIGIACMGSTLAMDGYTEEGARYVQRAYQIVPDNPRIIQILGMLNLDLKRPGEALVYFIYGLEANPGFKEVYPLLNVAAQRNGTPRLAIGQLERVIAQQPQNAEAHAYLGCAYGLVGQLQDAGRELLLADSLHPGMEIVGKGLKKLQEDLQAKRSTTRPATSTRPSMMSPAAK